MNLLVVGSIALDSLQGGKITDELGGSALYAALAASRHAAVGLVAPVGRDAAKRVQEVLAGRPIDAFGLDVLDAPTYRWFAADSHGRNIDLGCSDSIYDAWSPRVPQGFGGWAFVGSMRPDRQLEAVRRLAGCRLLAADAMRSYIEFAPEAARGVLEIADWYFCNRDELAALGGDDPQQFRHRWHLQGLVVKDGPQGAAVFTAAGRLHVPALTGEREVVDTTGAGDTLAGAMLASWLNSGGRQEALADAVREGVAAAALTISKVGLRALIGTAGPARAEGT